MQEIFFNEIQALNINRSQGLGKILVRIIKLCDQSIVKLLSTIFKNCIDNDIFCDIWEGLKYYFSS